jgi:hypothetical protein
MIAIFSYHSEDPDGVQGMQWHGIEQRGAQSLKLLSAQNSHIKIPTDAISIDFNFHCMILNYTGKQSTKYNTSK